MTTGPAITSRQGTPYVRVSGLFYRALDRRFLHRALAGSSKPGRYSRPDQPTLYMSATEAGVAAAMQAHSGPDTPERALAVLQVEAADILDLRNEAACHALGVDLADALAPWQEVVKAGGEPRSWQVADHLRALGANGLIDPSRTAPGLWHLVLFEWNLPGRPVVRLVG